MHAARRAQAKVFDAPLLDWGGQRGTLIMLLKVIELMIEFTAEKLSALS